MATSNLSLTAIAEEISTGINGDDPQIQLKCIKRVRSILSRPSPDIEGVVKLNIVPKVLELMTKSNDSEFQIECAWLITNLASDYKNGTDEILRLNGTESLRKLIHKTSNIHVRNQCFWAFSNIACENAKCRDIVLSEGIFEELVKFIEYIEKQNYLKVLKICIWSLTNFFLSKFPPPRDHVCQTGLKTFIRLFKHPNKSIYGEAIQGIYNILEKRIYIDEFIESGILLDIKRKLDGGQEDIKLTSCLILLVGNVAYGNDTQTQGLIDAGFIATFSNLLDNVDRQMKKDILWIISNIAAGSRTQVMALMDENIFSKILKYLDDFHFKIRREAIWIIYNATQSRSYEIIVHLVKLEVIRYLTKLLDDSNEEIVIATCDTIYNILHVGHYHFREVNLFGILVDKYGALKKLEMLQIHQSWTVIDKVISILEKFYRRDVKEVPKII